MLHIREFVTRQKEVQNASANLVRRWYYHRRLRNSLLGAKNELLRFACWRFWPRAGVYPSRVYPPRVQPAWRYFALFRQTSRVLQIFPFSICTKHARFPRIVPPPAVFPERRPGEGLWVGASPRTATAAPALPADGEQHFRCAAPITDYSHANSSRKFRGAAPTAGFSCSSTAFSCTASATDFRGARSSSDFSCCASRDSLRN
jgi:hypothetical protein